MSLLQPNFPGAGITLRALRDDGVTYAGITVPGEVFNLTAARTRLAAAPGLSAGEQARALLAAFPGFHAPREPHRFGPGWAIYNGPSGYSAFILRDDGTTLSVTTSPLFFTPSAAAAMFNATAGLTGTELARTASIALAVL